MGEFFKSALGGILGGSVGGTDNDFVGQNVELGDMKLRVRRVIAEGGFAFVFVAQDLATGKEYALKRLIAADDETSKLIIQEICFLKKLRQHPHIIQYVQAASIGKNESDHGKAEFLLLTELCTGGMLVDMLNSRKEPLLPSEVLHIFYQMCVAVQHMHKLNPPVIHRDLKVENFLISSINTIKLCDFGSATTKSYHPDNTWTAIQRSLVEDEMTKNTTPMYRAPEILETYNNYPINEAMDIWAMGCVLFLLCYREHPFEDSAKLRIVNGNYSIPTNDNMHIMFHDLITGMLQVDPCLRLSIDQVCAVCACK